MKFRRGIPGVWMLIILVLGPILTGCGSSPESGDSDGSAASSELSTDTGDGTEDNQDTGKRDNTPVVLVPETDKTSLYEGADVSLDASGAANGYILVRYSGSASKVRMLLTCPTGETYNYLLPLDNDYAVYPLTEGDGSYNVAVYENVYDDQYSVLFSQDISVTIKDPNRVFLYPNEYVDFNKDSKAVAKGMELAADADTDLDVVNAIYHYVIENIEYDYDKAETVQSGYVPVVDNTLAEGKGICFDFASLMTSMLRSQRIPTRLEVGYAGDVYHAWISVYVEDEGWIDGIITFDGKDWVLMDPTLASYASEATIKEYMDNSGSHYQIKYKY